MRLHWTQHIVTLCAASLLATGCATVDLNEMTAPAATNTAQADVNVVERAAAKLKAAFTNKGFVAKTSRKRMRSAAKVLLNGLENKNVTASADDGYLATPKPISVVSADMSFAKQHVIQTTRAAEIYLEMAPAERSLRKELKDLEAALMAAKEAGRVFEASLNGANTTELVVYNKAVDDLRDITNEFGARVRVQQSEKHAKRTSSI
ncbi:hypothetical protein ACJ3XI_06340 [Litorimonas sp. RW-G-Af-16]|uniref:hypothetical protein n=1 Tax=Litorimonas sp. RW-G-Af-16 TaxID=3241168 RepID=UPI00390C53BF